MLKKPPSKHEKQYMERVASLGCYINVHFPQYEKECGGRVEVHHQLGVIRSDYKTMGLCTNHHSAQTPLKFGCSVHKGTRSFEARYTTQAEIVRWTQEQLNYQEKF